MTPAQFVEVIPDRSKSYLRTGGSGEGYGDAGLELRLDLWAAQFRADRFRDGWLDFGFGQGTIVSPDEAFIESLDAFVAAQAQSFREIQVAFFPSIPMLRESAEGFWWASAFDGLDRPSDLLRVISPNVIHANRLSDGGWMIGASFLTDWEYPIGFLLRGGAVEAVGEQVAETAWMADAAANGTLTLENACWLAPP